MRFLRRRAEAPRPSAADDAYAALQSPLQTFAPTSQPTNEDTVDPWRQDLRSPWDSASWLSRLTLWWVNPAIARGYRKPLEEEDVWRLPATDTSDELQSKFDYYYAQAREARERATCANGSSGAEAHAAPQPPLPIHWPMWNSTKETMALAITLYVISATCTLMQPLLIKSLLQYIQGDENMFGISSGYTLAGLLTLASVIGVTALDYGMFLTARAGINARTIVVNGVYQKVLKLTSAARMAMNSGEVITLAGVDSERLFEAYRLGLWAIISPFVVTVSCILIGVEMGYLVGFAAAASSLIILTYAMNNSRQIGLVRRQILQVAGERIKVTNEVLQGIRVIKMYSWEESLAERVREIRDREIHLIRKYDYLRLTNLVVLSVAHTLMTAACFLVYIYQGHTLTAPTAFTLLAFANTCRVPFTTFSNAIVFTSEAWASMQRIALFLAADEVDGAVLMPSNDSDDDDGNIDGDYIARLAPGEPIIEIKDADFTWSVGHRGTTADVSANADNRGTNNVPITGEECDVPIAESLVSVPRAILRNLSLRIMPGGLTIVVGAVGSGKSSFVSALLGEIHQLSGSCDVRGRVAYASQEAWIQHNTVRDNIVFGARWDATHYASVLAACQMQRDLEILEHGDLTEIGERGINLSGGQKARVSLARVMYRRAADIVVLDDPLSALDVHVANAVFKECLLGLVRNKTRLLVLNAHYHLLKHADRILVLANGEIVGDGSYAQVSNQFSFLEDQAHEKAHQQASLSVGENKENDSSPSIEPNVSTTGSCSSLEVASGTQKNTRSWVDEDEERELLDDALRYCNEQDALAFAPPESLERMSIVSTSSALSRRSGRVGSRREFDEKTVKNDPDNESENANTSKPMMLQEERALGSITWQTYSAFLECSGWNGAWLGVALFAAFAIGQAALLGADYFVTYWSDGTLDNSFGQHSLLWLYIGIVVLATILSVLRAVFFTEICIRCSRVLHSRFFRKVLLAPIPTFFDVTPIGRILNRFSRDLDQIDNPLPYYSLAALMYAMLALAIFIVCAVTTPTTLILYAPLLGACYFVQAYFLASARELKRLDGVTRSPFLNLVAETLNGIESIRAFRMTTQFSEQCRELLDFNSKFFFMFHTSTKWFSMRLDWLVTSIVIVVSFTCVASSSSMGAGTAGIALTYAVQLTAQFQRLLNLASMTENYMTSFERIAHYGTLEQEGDQVDALPAPDIDMDAWPQRGTISFSNVFLRYRAGLDFVLRGVSFSIADGEKVGVCGRTGSGKSTLMNALFRTVELDAGTIRLDGVDIASVPLRELRQRLTIIPQDPVLFSGSLRANLDPFNEHTDEKLFSALRSVHLTDDIARWGCGLDYEVSEKGDNLSVGQRQLLCIARALLRESRVIVLDEATANVDQELDRRIQVAVKRSFAGRTSLTIAHRLETIADSDRVLVMDHGRVAEFDSPANLLVMPDGIFASLMHSTQSAQHSDEGADAENDTSV